MTGKLIKKDDHYFLEVEPYTLSTLQKHTIIANTFDKPKGDILQLSLKNCQEIERGYDLDELAKNCSKQEYYDWGGEVFEQQYLDTRYSAYKEGFQKALELMSDKKFSEEDMKDCWEKAFDVGYNFGHEQGDSTIANEDVDNYIQSLQQKEWDVEIEMIDYGIGNDEDGRPVIERKPLLDADGCLILKEYDREGK